MLGWLMGIMLITGAELEVPQQGDTIVRPVVIASDSSASDTLSDRTLQVDRLIIIGNKVTRQRIIERELSLMPGDTIRARLLAATLEWDKHKLYNLRLFNTVSVRALDKGNNRIDILVDLSERWYIFPVPIFELSDRNFNEWWNNYNHDLTRINYGLRIYKYNFRGRNETLRLTAQFGFYRKFDLQYRIPNLDRTQKHGLTFSFDFGAPRNLAYQTVDHKLEFLRQDNIVKESLGAGLTYSYRKTFFETHSVTYNYRTSDVTDTVLYLNPNYNNRNRTTQRYSQLSYYFVSEHRDVVLYPLKGYQLTAYLAKSGLLPQDDVDQLELNVTYAYHKPVGTRYFVSNFSSLFWSIPRNQPYSIYDALGYRNLVIRGFENYVVEGPAFALNKTTFKRKIFGKSWTIDKMPIEQFNYFPLAVYLKVYADFGYVNNYDFYQEKSLNTRLSNRFLMGAGAGIDVVTVYDLVVRFEYTFTQDQKGGFFLNARKEF
jgi:outer membrane protein assembly factor BamA